MVATGLGQLEDVCEELCPACMLSLVLYVNTVRRCIAGLAAYQAKP